MNAVANSPLSPQQIHSANHHAQGANFLFSRHCHAKYSASCQTSKIDAICVKVSPASGRPRSYDHTTSLLPLNYAPKSIHRCKHYTHRFLTAVVVWPATACPRRLGARWGLLRWPSDDVALLPRLRLPRRCLQGPPPRQHLRERRRRGESRGPRTRRRARLMRVLPFGGCVADRRLC